MDSDALVQMLQKGFRVTLGATASLIEILQDPDRRDENLGRLTTDWDGLAEEWAVKGEMTEQEARNFVETILTQQTGQNGSTSGATTTPPTTPNSTNSVEQPTPYTDRVHTDVQELTAQISAIRAELEKLRQQD
jgi:polyhydroxyalkanoate synthesis regulator phasin